MSWEPPTNAQSDWATLPAYSPQQNYAPVSLGDVPPQYIGELAGPAKRFGAALLEIPLMVVTLVIGWIIWDLIAWRAGQSPAKQLLAMRIVDSRTGVPITWGRSFLRNFVLIGVLGLVPMVGWIYRVVGACFVFSANRQALWDRMAGTYVLNSPRR
jgi:uncharacterized RDD family membrane protein YckC